jgi:antitoxin (DNA-binding transcriptional repressor) of toxin-antitoxin stability system
MFRSDRSDGLQLKLASTEPVADVVALDATRKQKRKAAALSELSLLALLDALSRLP